jgi:hypothetical protein
VNKIFEPIVDKISKKMIDKIVVIQARGDDAQ